MPEKSAAPESSDKSVFAVEHREAWYVLATEAELKPRWGVGKPLQRKLFGSPITIFTTEQGVGALEDRCSHRNVPLSGGRVVDSCLQCPYHGWRFDAQGECVEVPGRVDCRESKGRLGRAIPAYAAKIQDGLVWVYGAPDVQPSGEPYRLPLLGDRRYGVVRRDLSLQGTVHAVAENALDVPHTAFLHGGLFRGATDKGVIKRHTIDVEVKRFADRVEAHYLGEPRPSGLLGKLLAPQGGTVTHVDRFLLPSIAQVEYALGDAHVLATSMLTPTTLTQTHLFGVVSFKLPKIAGRIAGLAGEALAPLGMWILGQDAQILRAQRATLDHFGGEQFASTELDVLGPTIARMLRSAARGEALPEERTRRLQMSV